MKISSLITMYRLRKPKKILFITYQRWEKKKGSLNQTASLKIENKLYRLQQAIINEDILIAHKLSKEAENFLKEELAKTMQQKCVDTLLALSLALVAAVIIRQCVFELYEIPTGSMRPTLKEKDRLLVSKTTFGINIPLTTKHCLFDPSLIERNGIFVFTGKGMDIKDVDTKYFYLFPGKKQYIKRLMAKPHDTIYFYGGQLYGIDENGHDITSLLQPEILKNVEHIPFIHFDGKVQTSIHPHYGIYSSVTFKQMNEAVAKLQLNHQNQIFGEMLASREQKMPSLMNDYYDLWGFKNYGMTRIITRDSNPSALTNLPPSFSDYEYFLEIKHHPSLKSARLARDERGRLRPMLGVSSSIIPLDEKHMRAIFSNLYTARFVVKNGFAYRYGSSWQGQGKAAFLPRLPGVPDGTYEFYFGKPYEILWQGITKELDDTHPLATFSLEKTELLYNTGIEFDTRFSPQNTYGLLPSRYTYFKNGALFLMGREIFAKEDPLLHNFLAREEAKSSVDSYRPFIDYGPPLDSNGNLDVHLIGTYGLKIPKEGYLALGDNHAMSADSRDFGFVPESNLRGSPDLIFWPYGSRWGFPIQAHYPMINLPRSVVWAFLMVCSFSYMLYSRKKYKRYLPLSKEERL